MRITFTKLASAVVGLTLASALLALVGSAPAAQAATNVQGVDVSAFQHPNGAAINWASVAQTEEFAIIKATEGRSGNWDNPWFGRDFDGAKRTGMVVGSYHFADVGTPVVDDAKGEAQHYWAIIKSRSGAGTLPPILDIESTKGLSNAQVQSWTQTFMAEIQRLSGRTPILYTYTNFWNSHLAGSTLNKYPLWLAQYGVSSPNTPSAFSKWTLWQYTDKARVNGISSPVDRNYFNGTLAQLKALAQGSGSTTPPPTQQPVLRNGKCETGEFCYYYNSDYQGSVSDLPAKLANYGTDPATCYVFKSAAAGQGQCVKNNAASVQNLTSRTIRVYYNSNFGGSWVAIAPGTKRNLRGTCCYNQNASHQPV